MSLDCSLTYSEYLYMKQPSQLGRFSETILLRVVLVQGTGCHDRGF